MRCFCEWRKADRRPFYLRPEGGGLFAVAGVWDSGHGEGKPLLTCCIVATAANSLVQPIPDRVPAVLTAVRFGIWLNADTPADAPTRRLVPFPADMMEVFSVVRLADSPKNEGAELMNRTA